MSNGIMFTFPSLNVSTAFKSFKFIFFKSIKPNLSSKLVSNAELFEFSVVESNWPNKSPVMLFRSGVICLSLRFPETLIFELSFPLMIPAIGTIFFIISNCVKVWAISTSLKPKSILNWDTFPFVETSPLKAMDPPKILVIPFTKVAFWSLIIIFPETFFSTKLSYKTVLAFAVKVQFKNAGIFMASAGLDCPFLASVSEVIKSLTAN